MTDTQLSPDTTDLDGLVSVGAPADGSTRRFRAGSYDEALAMALDELGPEVEVVEANRIRRGGLGGFFATDLGIEITVTTPTLAGDGADGGGVRGRGDRTDPVELAAVRPYLPEDLGTADRGSLAGQTLGMTDARLQELLDRAEETERRELPQRRPGTSTPFADAYAEQVRAQLGDRPRAVAAGRDAVDRGAAPERTPAVEGAAEAGVAAPPSGSIESTESFAALTPGSPDLAVDEARAAHERAPSAELGSTAGSSGGAALPALGLDGVSADAAPPEPGSDGEPAGAPDRGPWSGSDRTPGRLPMVDAPGSAHLLLDAGPRLPAGCHRPIVRSAPSGFLDGAAVADRSAPAAETSGDRDVAVDPFAGRERCAASDGARGGRGLPVDPSIGRDRSATAADALDDRSVPDDRSTGRLPTATSAAPGDEPTDLDVPPQRSSRQLLTLLGTLGGPPLSPPAARRSPEAAPYDLAAPPPAAAIAPPALPDRDDLPWAGTIRVAPPAGRPADVVADPEPPTGVGVVTLAVPNADPVASVPPGDCEPVAADVSPATTTWPGTRIPAGSIAVPSVGEQQRVSANAADAVAVVMPMEGPINRAPVDPPAAMTAGHAAGGAHG